MDVSTRQQLLGEIFEPLTKNTCPEVLYLPVAQILGVPVLVSNITVHSFSLVPHCVVIVVEKP